MLDAALTNVVNNIDSRGRVVECDVPSDLPALRTDPILLQRVIGNIVSNACRFGPADKPVTSKRASSATRSVAGGGPRTGHAGRAARRRPRTI